MVVDVFENAKSIRIHNKEVQSIKTLQGRVIWEKGSISPNLLYCEYYGSKVTFGAYGSPWIYGELTIDWGDGTTTEVSTPSSSTSHTYTDGLDEHTVIFDRQFTQITDLTFGGQNNLIGINIPSTVTSINNGAFWGCVSIQKYILNWKSNILSFEDANLYEGGNAVISIPNGTTQAYISAGYPSDRLVERNE